MEPNRRCLIWTTSSPTERELHRKGWSVFAYGDLQHQFIEPARNATATRNTLKNAASDLVALLENNPKLAVTGVPLDTIGDLQDVYSFLIEPAFRRDVLLMIVSNRSVTSLEPSRLVDPLYDYPWTLQRLDYLNHFYLQGIERDGNPPMTPIEEMLFAALKARGLSPTVQYGIGSFRVDFAFSDRQLAVEADGRAWHDAKRDAERDRRLRAHGWETVRFSGSQIYRDADAVVEQIISALERRPEIVPRTPVAPSQVSRPWWRRLLDWILRRTPPPPEDSTDRLPVPSASEAAAPWKEDLDTDQRRAVEAHEGVVQVIAPAGSGKTRTMIARVHELISRGVPPNRILCTTFNRDARDELEARLKEDGVTNVEVRSFHAVGYRILREEGLLRSDVRRTSYATWRKLARDAMDAVENGVWIEPATAAELVSNYKLEKLWDPDTARQRARTAIDRTAAEIYRLHEIHTEAADVYDFDDLIYRPLIVLRSDDTVRNRWQRRWECVLVDEYQDIEPAQELLIQILAAPEDSIFVVGDEDQCIYAWRRASVERIVLLDTKYPGLERIVLSTSYRCPPRVTEASRRLIERNRRRFPKAIRSSPDTNTPGTIDVVEMKSPSEGAMWVTELLEAEYLDRPRDVVVLARTSRLLREVARACASSGIRVSVPERAVTATDSEATVLAYLRLASGPTLASSEDVDRSFRVPNRYLPRGAAIRVAELLRAGRTFREAIAEVDAEAWRRRGLQDWADLLSDLAAIDSAADALDLLRTRGGLDRHYASVEQMTPHDQVEIEALDELTQWAEEVGVSEFVTKLAALATGLSVDSSDDAIELNTIHGAKGREWATVVLFGADRDQMPHLRALSAAETDEQFDELVEDERRLAYVALTRTKERFVAVVTDEPSPFLHEAGLGSSTRPTSVPSRNEVEARFAAIARRNRDDATGSNLRGTPDRTGATAARYPGMCPVCGGPIEIGTRIARDRRGWVHEQCQAL